MGTMKFTFEAGALVRGKAIKHIKDVAFMKNLSLKIDEDKGILESNFRIKLEGSNEKILAAKDDIQSFLAKMETESNA